MSFPLRDPARLAAFALLAALAACADEAATPAPDGPADGTCAEACETDADCCTAGVPGCPGAYPLNRRCEGGLCTAPACQEDSDCAPFANACGELGGVRRCAFSCVADADCSAFPGASCSETTLDDGRRLCRLAGERPTCESDADCLGGLHCLAAGHCGCASDDECRTGHCSADGSCGCSEDSHCAAIGLDACTTEPGFEVPAGAAPACGGCEG